MAQEAPEVDAAEVRSISVVSPLAVEIVLLEDELEVVELLALELGEELAEELALEELDPPGMVN